MYWKRKRTKTDASVDMEKIKEHIKQELVVEMQMQRWCCHQCPIAQAFTRDTEEQLCLHK
jgi:hypothetical protein